MIKFLSKIKQSIRVNQHNFLTNKFIDVFISHMKSFITRNITDYNFLISFKVSDSNKNVILQTKFMPINLRSLDYFIKKIIDILLSLNKNRSIIYKDFYFVLFRVPINLIFLPIDFPGGLFHMLPITMNRDEWDEFIKSYSHLKILDFTVTENKGWLENKITLLDSIKQEKIIIFDVKDVKDLDISFLRRSSNHIIHYLNGNVVSCYLVDHNPLNKNET